MSSNSAADACACCVRSSQQVSRRCLFKGMCLICPEMGSDAHWMLFIFLHRAADAEWKERGAKMLKMMGEHTSPNMPKSQALKDATMAHFILQNWSADKLFVHYNGSYHSEFHEGISWYLKRLKPDLKIITIATVTQKSLSELLPENLLKADFIICVDEDMTSTY